MLNLPKSYKFSNVTYKVKSNMSDPSKRKSNIFLESPLIVKGQKNSNNAQTVAPLSELRPTEVRMNFPGVFPGFLLAMRQWLSSELAHVQSRASASQHHQ